MDEKQTQIYEVGYHIVPTVSEEKLGDKVGAIKQVLDGIGASLISEEHPKMIPLAYEIKRRVEGANAEKFNTAYFGWIKFESESTKIAELNEKLDKNDDILRYIVIKTVRENTIYVKTFNAQKGEEEGDGQPITEEDEKKIEESIEELVIE